MRPLAWTGMALPAVSIDDCSNPLDCRGQSITGTVTTTAANGVLGGLGSTFLDGAEQVATAAYLSLDDSTASGRPRPARERAAGAARPASSRLETPPSSGVPRTPLDRARRTRGLIPGYLTFGLFS